MIFLSGHPKPEVMIAAAYAIVGLAALNWSGSPSIVNPGMPLATWTSTLTGWPRASPRIVAERTVAIISPPEDRHAVVRGLVFRRECGLPSGQLARTISRGCRIATATVPANATLVGVLRPSPGPAAIFAAIICRDRVTTLAGCGDDGVQSDAERFCGEAVTRRDMIVAPPMATEQEVEATLDFYRLMGELAPVAIAEQWNQIVTAMETASTVAPGDPDRSSRWRSRRTPPSARRTRSRCG